MNGLGAVSRLCVLLGRLAGFAGASISAVFWVYFTFGHATVPGGDGASGMTYVVAGLMVTLAFAGAWAALRDRLAVLLVAFAASFFPVGYYLLMTPGGWWIGAGNLLLLGAGLLMAVGRLASFGAGAPDA